MNDPGAVGMGHGRHDLEEPGEEIGQRPPLAGLRPTDHGVSPGLSLDIFEDQVGQVSVQVRREQIHHVGVVQSLKHLQLSANAAPPVPAIPQLAVVFF